MVFFLYFQTLQLHDALVRIGLLPKHSIASSCPLTVPDIDDGLDVITYFLPEQVAPEPNVGLNVITYFPQEQVEPEQVEIDGRRCKSISSRCSFRPHKRDVPKRSCRVVWPRTLPPPVLSPDSIVFSKRAGFKPIRLLSRLQKSLLTRGLLFLIDIVYLCIFSF
jgi:hypothetical protein